MTQATPDETGNDGAKKAAYAIGGGVLGALLALVAIWAMVFQQNSQTQPQHYQAQINYDQ